MQSCTHQGRMHAGWRLEASGSLEGSVEGEGRVEAEAGMTANMRAESRSRGLEAEDSG